MVYDYLDHVAKEQHVINLISLMIVLHFGWTTFSDSIYSFVYLFCLFAEQVQSINADAVLFVSFTALEIEWYKYGRFVN